MMKQCYNCKHYYLFKNLHLCRKEKELDLQLPDAVECLYYEEAEYV